MLQSELLPKLNTMSQPIIDLIIRIKNGYMAKKEKIESPYSKFREAVLKKLKQVGFIKDYKVEEVRPKIKKFVIELKYTKTGEPVLSDVKIYSKPGRRWYVGYRDITPVKGGRGYGILTTPKGVLTNVEAKRQKVGGELLFEVW